MGKQKNCGLSRNPCLVKESKTYGNGGQIPTEKELAETIQDMKESDCHIKMMQTLYGSILEGGYLVTAHAQGEMNKQVSVSSGIENVRREVKKNLDNGCKKVYLVSGSFQLVHLGHLEFLHKILSSIHEENPEEKVLLIVTRDSDSMLRSSKDQTYIKLSHSLGLSLGLPVASQDDDLGRLENICKAIIASNSYGNINVVLSALPNVIGGQQFSDYRDQGELKGFIDDSDCTKYAERFNSTDDIAPESLPNRFSDFHLLFLEHILPQEDGQLVMTRFVSELDKYAPHVAFLMKVLEKRNPNTIDGVSVKKVKDIHIIDTRFVIKLLLQYLIENSLLRRGDILEKIFTHLKEKFLKFEKENNNTSSGSIKGFYEDNFFLSNFSKHSVTYDGIRFPTLEHAYQYGKFAYLYLDPSLRQSSDIDFRKFFSDDIKPRSIRQYAHTLEGKIDKDRNEKGLYYMIQLVYLKFKQNPKLEELLLATGDSYLEETNRWGDQFWGVCKGVGENNLGKVLMIVRSYLRKDRL